MAEQKKPDFDSIKQTDISERHYVYVLAYPDGRIFYVGKGVGDRIHEHEREARKGIQSEKCHIIRGIWGSGEEVFKTKIAFFDTDIVAQRYECWLISSLGGLTNIAQGRKNIKEILLTSGDIRYFGASIRHLREDDTEYYDAREAADFFGYTNWSNFHKVIKRAMKVSNLNGNDVQEDFIRTYKVVCTGKGRTIKRSIENYQLSREAFLLVTMNADPSTIVVELGKYYIALSNAKLYDRPRDPEKEKLPDGLDGWSKNFGKVTDNLASNLARIERFKNTIHASMPEDLPSAPSIRKMVEERRRKTAKQRKIQTSEQQNSLFVSDDDPAV